MAKKLERLVLAHLVKKKKFSEFIAPLLLFNFLPANLQFFENSLSTYLDYVVCYIWFYSKNLTQLG